LQAGLRLLLYGCALFLLLALGPWLTRRALAFRFSGFLLLALLSRWLGLTLFFTLFGFFRDFRRCLLGRFGLGAALITIATPAASAAVTSTTLTAI
jgi:hypothetical protein